MKMESLHSPSLVDFQALVGIVFSAVTYLFDFSSNIATAIEYHDMGEEHPFWKKFFYAFLAVMAVGHIVNAVIFKLELKKEDQPLKSAYLLPLMQLRRLVQALWRTCSCKGLGDLKAAEDKKALYNILSISLETGPQLILQFDAFHLYYAKTGGPPPKTLLVSICASFLSGTVNGGLAILAESRIGTQDVSWRVKMVGFIIAGLSTFSSLLLQCLTSLRLVLLGLHPILVYYSVVTLYIILFAVLLRTRPSPSTNALIMRVHCTGRRFLHCAAWSYVSVITGPLQPLTRDAKVKNELGKVVYWYRLLLVSTVQLCLYGGLFLWCLVGPSQWRWATLCPVKFKGSRCEWQAPLTILGMSLYSVAISSHIFMDNYVNRSCIRIYPGLSEMQADLEFATQINDINKSMHKELHETADDAHKVNDVNEEQEDWEASKHSEQIQIACEVPGGTLKKIRSHGKGEINYIETTGELHSSHGQVWNL